MKVPNSDKKGGGLALIGGATILGLSFFTQSDAPLGGQGPRIHRERPDYLLVPEDVPGGAASQGNFQGGSGQPGAPGGGPNGIPAPSSFPNMAQWTDEYQQLATEAARRYGLDQIQVSEADKARYFPGVEGNPTAEDWGQFMGRMAYYESGHNTNTTYGESFTNQHGEQVISTGLTQISYASAAGYKDANGNNFNLTTEELKNPATNLDVTASILSTWVSRDGTVAGGSSGAWEGGARYWSIFRTGKL